MRRDALLAFSLISTNCCHSAQPALPPLHGDRAPAGGTIGLVFICSVKASATGEPQFWQLLSQLVGLASLVTPLTLRNDPSAMEIPASGVSAAQAPVTS